MWIRVPSRLLLSLALIATASSALAAKSPKPKPPSASPGGAPAAGGSEKPWAEWAKLTKDAEQKKGFFTLWKKRDNLYLQIVATPAGESWILHSQLFFRGALDGAHLFQGVTDSTMSHGEGWQYIQLGRFVERTHGLATLIGTHFRKFTQPWEYTIDTDEYLEWVGLLKDCAAFEAYCKKYTAELRPLRVAEFLLLNPDFPHSVRFSVDKVHSALRSISELTERKADSPAPQPEGHPLCD